MQPHERARWVIEEARKVGFDLCGITRVDSFAELASLPEWLARGYAGEMKYLEDPRRLDPQLVLDGVQSIIVCAVNYNSSAPYSIVAAAEPSDDSGPRGWISRYAWGNDYHDWIRQRLETLAAAMRAKFEDRFTARAYVDTGPVVERVAAQHAGLGWLAKNTCLINEELGSWLFLGVILTDLELLPAQAPHETPPADLCGNCTLCLDACPTGALVEPYVLDARRCISYLTIELRGQIPAEFRGAVGQMVFGCDICQDVCPWNRKAPPTAETEFLPRKIRATEAYEASMSDGTGDESESLFAPPLEWIASLSETEFQEMFRGSAVKRTKWRGLIRNACVALGNSKLSSDSEASPRVVRQLERLANSEDEIISEHARWAIERLRSAR
ncbi:MAG: tRNA epoxyqueuosine(34) reductase QueG [Candidatus Acidiferrales bacterium]